VKILFDQGTPLPLRAALSGHLVSTVYEMGWAELANGELLDAAEAQQFEVLVTTHKNLRYQQNLSTRRIAILVLPFASWPRLKSHAGAIAQVIGRMEPHGFVEWGYSMT
jgi:hypothetical protein